MPGSQALRSGDYPLQTEFTVMTLQAYIARYYGGSRRKFIDATGVSSTALSRWIQLDWVIANGRLFSPKQKLPEVAPLDQKESKEIRSTGG